jgi:glutaredoxin 3
VAGGEFCKKSSFCKKARWFNGLFYKAWMVESYLNEKYHVSFMSVKVFSRAGDPYSDMLKNVLKYHRIEFENIEVSRDPDALRQLIRESGQDSTPVLVVGGKAYVGFDHQMIKDVLGLPKQQA